MVLRWIATSAIVLLLGLDVFLPWTGLGRRGAEAAVRTEVPTSQVALGQPFPDVGLVDLDGRPVSMETLRGHRVLLTFERSLDW